MSSIIVTGGSSGLGDAIVRELWTCGHVVVNLDVTPPHYNHGSFFKVNLQSPEEVAQTCNIAAHHLGGVDVLINCAGINHIEWLYKLAEDDWDRVMNTNARAIFLTSKYLVHELRKSKGTIINIVSNASHMPMTASLAYNASKGAAHIMTLQMARELTKLYGITVFGISPNKMAGTAMSQYIEDRVPEVRGMTRAEAAEYQRKALLTGEETPPEAVAEFIGFLLGSKERHRFLSGCVIPYGA